MVSSGQEYCPYSLQILRDFNFLAAISEFFLTQTELQPFIQK
jgi:hypothetical protein